MALNKEDRMSKTIPNDLTRNFGDIECRRNLMALYGDSRSSFSGENEHGESVIVSISRTGIITNTFQSNGWVRVNVYDEKGFPAGETFDGKWK